MLAPADQPPDDILDYVVVDTDKTGQIRVRVVEGKKHLRAVQDYLTRLCSRYPGKVPLHHSIPVCRRRVWQHRLHVRGSS